MSFCEFLTAVTLAAIVGVLGNFCVQRRFSYLREIEELKHRYYDFMQMASDYWRSENLSAAKRRELESAIISSHLTIYNEHKLISEKKNCFCCGSGRISRSYEEITNTQVKLWDAASGGCFQQKDWKPDHGKAALIAKLVMQIVKTFY